MRSYEILWQWGLGLLSPSKSPPAAGRLAAGDRTWQWRTLPRLGDLAKLIVRDSIPLKFTREKQCCCCCNKSTQRHTYRKDSVESYRARTKDPKTKDYFISWHGQRGRGHVDSSDWWKETEGMFLWDIYLTLVTKLEWYTLLLPLLTLCLLFLVWAEICLLACRLPQNNMEIALASDLH